MTRSRSAVPGPRVLMTLGGNVESGSGHTRSPSTWTWYSVVGVRGQPLDGHQGVVAALHLERGRRAAEHLDGGRCVGLDPHHGGGVADVAQNGTEYEGHPTSLGRLPALWCTTLQTLLEVRKHYGERLITATGDQLLPAELNR